MDQAVMSREGDWLGEPVKSVEVLAAQASRGDREAFGELYERYADMVLRIACAKLPHDRAAAEDVAAETWVRVAHGIKVYKPVGGGFPAWLQTIAQRLVADHYRSQTRRRECPTGDLLALESPTDGDTPEMAAIRREMAELVAKALERLSARHREFLTWRFFHGLSYAETARMLGMTENACRQLQFRALDKLCSHLPEGLTESRAISMIATVKTHGLSRAS